MIKVVLTVQEEVCLANGKDPAATELLEKMKLWGKVEPLEKVTAAIEAEYQARIDALVDRYKTVEAQELIDDEIVWLNFIRERKAIETDIFMKQIAARDKVIEDVRADSQKRAEQLAHFAEQLKDLAQ
jgi:hypothetical protein